MDEPLVALDLFAGTGWSVAAHPLGIRDYGVELMPEARATREAAGMLSAGYNDVWDGLVGTYRATPYGLLIASPPCQTFSAAGAGAGRKALGDVYAAIAEGLYERPEELHGLTESLDPRTALVLTPLAHVYRDRPRFVVLEQVPPVLPVWEACAAVMRLLGYSVVTGILNAEQYGVPQTRRRAILIARNDGVPARMPTPTHSRYYSRSPEKLDEGVEKWVSMAEALGWDEAEIVGFPRVDDGRKNGSVSLDGVDYRKRDLRGTDHPANTVTQKARSWHRWCYERPATTIVADPRLGGPGRSEFVKGGVSRQNRPGSLRLEVDEAATLQSYPRGWGFTDRPAVTVGNAVGRGLIGGSGAKATVVRALEEGTFIPSQGDGSNYAAATRITVEQAGALQSFPSRFPFQGTKTKQFLQVGNAVPPLLAHAILSTLID